MSTSRWTQLRSGRAVLTLVALLLLAACGEADDQAAPDPPDTDTDVVDEEPEPEPEPEPFPFADGEQVTIVVPFGAGGGYDTTTRLFAPCVETAFEEVGDVRVSVVVQNVPGGGSETGTLEVYGADPDGTSVLLNAIDILTPLQVVEGADFELANFEAVARFITSHRSLLIRSDVLPEDADLMDLIERSQTEPVLVGDAALAYQFAMMHILLEEGGAPIDWNFVTFDSSAEAVASMLRGEIELYLVTSETAVELAEANEEVRILNYLSEDDGAEADIDAPSLADSGVPNAEEIGLISGSSVRSFLTTPGTPEDRLEALREVFRVAMDGTDCVQDIEDTGAIVAYGDAEQLEQAAGVFTSVYEQHLDRLGEVLDEFRQ